MPNFSKPLRQANPETVANPLTRQTVGDSNETTTWATIRNVEVNPGALLTFLRVVGLLSRANDLRPGGCNSVVEYLLPKQKVAGSNPITRSVYRLIKGFGWVIGGRASHQHAHPNSTNRSGSVS